MGLDKAREISLSVSPFVTRVGLFMNAAADEVNEVLARVPIDLLQFHGNETGAFCEQFGLPYIKAVAFEACRDAAEIEQKFSAARGFLIDSHAGSTAGGTGETFDWKVIPDPHPRNAIIAGGITPANVADCIRQLRPYAIDVSSGVEESPGVKSRRKIEALVENMRTADG